MSAFRGNPEVAGRGQDVAIDPNVWSGRALQVDFAELAVSGLASMLALFGPGTMSDLSP